jgi:hypothetical protein
MAFVAANCHGPHVINTEAETISTKQHNMKKQHHSTRKDKEPARSHKRFSKEESAKVLKMVLPYVEQNLVPDYKGIAHDLGTKRTGSCIWQHWERVLRKKWERRPTKIRSKDKYSEPAKVTKKSTKKESARLIIKISEEHKEVVTLESHEILWFCGRITRSRSREGCAMPKILDQSSFNEKYTPIPRECVSYDSDTCDEETDVSDYEENAADHKDQECPETCVDQEIILDHLDRDALHNITQDYETNAHLEPFCSIDVSEDFFDTKDLPNLSYLLY